MPNPLFAPQPPRPPKRPEPWRWIDPKEKAFSVVVAAGWTADGGLRRFERGQRYVVFTLTGPDGASPIEIIARPKAELSSTCPLTPRSPTCHLAR